MSSTHHNVLHSNEIFPTCQGINGKLCINPIEPNFNSNAKSYHCYFCKKELNSPYGLSFESKSTCSNDVKMKPNSGENNYKDKSHRYHNLSQSLINKIKLKQNTRTKTHNTNKNKIKHKINRKRKIKFRKDGTIKSMKESETSGNTYSSDNSNYFESFEEKEFENMIQKHYQTTQIIIKDTKKNLDHLFGTIQGNSNQRYIACRGLIKAVESVGDKIELNRIMECKSYKEWIPFLNKNKYPTTESEQKNNNESSLMQSSGWFVDKNGKPVIEFERVFEYFLIMNKSKDFEWMKIINLNVTEIHNSRPIVKHCKCKNPRCHCQWKEKVLQVEFMDKIFMDLLVGEKNKHYNYYEDDDLEHRFIYLNIVPMCLFPNAHKIIESKWISKINSERNYAEAKMYKFQSEQLNKNKRGDSDYPQLNSLEKRIFGSVQEKQLFNKKLNQELYSNST